MVKPHPSGLKIATFSNLARPSELASCKTLANSRPAAASPLRIVLGPLVHAGDGFRLYSSLLRLSPNRGIVAAQGVFIP